MQQPDSTVISEPSSKDSSSCFSFDTSGIMSSSCSVPLGSKKPAQIRRSSTVSVDSDCDYSDGIIHVNPVNRKPNKTIHAEDEICDSPSTHSLKSPRYTVSKNNSADLGGADLFFSPKKPNTVSEKKSSPATEDIEPDDFYVDDFDIDDLNDSDIPGYFDEPQTPSAPSQKSSTVTRIVREGGPATSPWEKKPTTPVSAPKPSKICSPGNHCLSIER